MNASALWADTRETLRLRAFRARLVREHERTTLPAHRQLARRLERPLLRAVLFGYPLVLVVWPHLAVKIVFFTCAVGFWAVVAARKWLLLARPSQGDRSFGAFSMLHAPSRRGLLASSWMRTLPWPLWIGACAVVFVIRRPDAFGHVSPAMLAAVGMTPLLLFALSTWAVLAEDQGDWTIRGLALATAAAMTVFCAAGLVAGVLAGVHGDASGWIGAPVLAGLGGGLGWNSWRTFVEWRTRRRPRAGLARAAARVAAVLVPVVWSILLIFLATDDADDRAKWERFAGGWGPPAALCVVVATTAFFLVEQLVWIDTVQLGAFTAAPKRHSQPALGRARTGTAKPGVSLWRAQWRLLRESHPLLSIETWLLFVLFCGAGPVLGLVAVATSDSGVNWAAAALAATLSPRLVAIDPRHALRLHLFGFGMREQRAHDLRALFFVAAPMTLAGGATACFLGGWTATRIAALGAIAACVVGRAGNLGFGVVRSRLRQAIVVGAWVAVMLLPSLLQGFVGATDAAATAFAMTTVTILGLAGLRRSMPRGRGGASTSRAGSAS